MENGNRDGSSSFFIFEGEYRVGFGISVSDECFFFFFFEANIRDQWSLIFVILNYRNTWIEDILYLYVG